MKILRYLKIKEIGGMALAEGKPSAITAAKTLCTANIKVDDKIIPLKMYKEVSNTEILLPRYLFNKHIELKGNWGKVDIKFTKTLMPHQPQLVNDIIDSYNSGDYGGILKAGTGTGKSVVALYIASKLKLPTIIIVPLRSILKQWIDYILEFTDIKEEEIGLISRDIARWKGKKITLAMLHSLAKRKDKGYEKELFSYFGLSIWDEGHVLGAKTFSEVVKLFNDKYRLMLSATPRRPDDGDKVFKYHIGDIITEYNKELVTPIVYKAIWRVNPKNFKVYGNSFVRRKAQLLTQLKAEHSRTAVVASYIKKFADAGRNVLVLSDRIDLLNRVGKRLMDGRGKTYPYSRFYSNYKETDKNIILATYGSVGMAVNIPKLDTLILLTPRSDTEQAIGRILRAAGMSRKKQPIVMDIVDANIPEFEKLWNSRKAIYYRKGIRIKTIRLRGGKDDKK